MSDIAARAGTSIGVVSVALNGAKSKTLRVSAETRERVLAVAEEMGYRRDARASALATGKNHVLGLMLPYLHAYASPDPFYSLITSGVAAVAARQGYNLMLYTAVAEEEGKRAAEMIDRRIDGLVLVIPPAETPIYEECRKLGIATVSVSQRPEVAPTTVNSDEYAGGRLAMAHLIELGHRRIAHLAGNPEIYTSDIRLQAYRDAMSEIGAPELVREGGFNRGIAYESTKKLLLEERPTAIFAANDLSAHGAVEAIQEAGLRIPDDISVVGYDDSWYATIPNPPLTSVNQNIEGIGRRAAELLIATLEGRAEDPHPVLPVSLTVRRSSGPAPNLT